MGLIYVICSLELTLPISSSVSSSINTVISYHINILITLQLGFLTQ